MTADRPTTEPRTAEEAADLAYPGTTLHDRQQHAAFREGWYTHKHEAGAAQGPAPRAEGLDVPLQRKPRTEAEKALDRLDEIAPTLWQQQPKGHPMMPMQIIIREWVATIRSALAVAAPRADWSEYRPDAEEEAWMNAPLGAAPRAEGLNPIAAKLHRRIDNWPVNADQKRDEHADLDAALVWERHIGASVEDLARGIHEWKGRGHKSRNPVVGQAPDDCDIDAATILRRSRPSDERVPESELHNGEAGE